MKKQYESPELTKTAFAVEDIVTTSPGGGIVLPDDDWD